MNIRNTIKRWKDKAQADWMRSTHNLPPRPMDTEDKIVIFGGLAVIVFFSLLLIEGLINL